MPCRRRPSIRRLRAPLTLDPLVPEEPDERKPFRSEKEHREHIKFMTMGLAKGTQRCLHPVSLKPSSVWSFYSWNLPHPMCVCVHVYSLMYMCVYNFFIWAYSIQPGTHYLDQAGFWLTENVLSLPPEGWDKRCAPPRPATFLLFQYWMTELLPGMCSRQTNERLIFPASRDI